MHSGVPILDIYARQLKSGQKVQHFKKYIELRYKNIPGQLSRKIKITGVGELITKNNRNECFYEVYDNTVTVYTKHFSLIVPDCGIPGHEYHSPVIVNICHKEISYGFKFKIYLTTVGIFLYYNSSFGQVAIYWNLYSKDILLVAPFQRNLSNT